MNTPSEVVVPAESPMTGFYFALPWLIGLVGLTILPTAASLLLSFTEWDGLSVRDGLHWVGTEHYRDLISSGSARRGDTLFYKALSNSLYYTIIAVPLGLITSLAVALLLNRPLRGIGLFRTLLYLPHLLGGVATIIIWSWLFNPQFGPVNAVIGGLYGLLDPVVGLFRQAGTSDWPVPDWFYSPASCKPALIIMHCWLGGGSMLIFLAALQRVPATLLDAAALDGAGPWHRFRHVTVPHISGALLFNALVGVIFAMQSFDQAYLLYNRAQQDGLLFYMLQLYRAAFEPPYRIGRASAMAWILFVVIALLSTPVIILARRRVYYEVER